MANTPTFPPTPGLDYTVQDRVAYLTLNRPEKKNALTAEMYAGLRLWVLRAEDDPDVDLIVLTGSGSEIFCTGGDLSMSAERRVSTGAADQMHRVEGSFPWPAWERMRKLILTVVNGKAMAAGLISVLMSDLTIGCRQHTKLRVPELLRGLPDPFIPVRLQQHVGVARARWLMYTAEEIDADEAERIGLLGKVVDHEELTTTVKTTIAAVLRTAPRARGLYKKMMYEGVGGPVNQDLFLEHYVSPEATEGTVAFAEKRAPSWASDVSTGRL